MAAIPILHEDEDLVVVDKPPGILVVHAPGQRGPVLVDLLATQLGGPALPVHRLDRDTSGLMVFARTTAARRVLQAGFRAHAIDRDYLALASRTPSPPAGTIESRLDESGDRVRTVRRGGRLAVTHYRTLERRGTAALVWCRLQTGRRNQIRVHLAELDCPLVGDRKYGWRGKAAPRVMLHSFRMRLQHPQSGAELRFRVQAPEPELHFDAAGDWEIDA